VWDLDVQARAGRTGSRLGRRAQVATTVTADKAAWVADVSPGPAPVVRWFLRDDGQDGSADERLRSVVAAGSEGAVVRTVGIVFGAGVMLGVYGGTNFYVATRLFQWSDIFLPTNGVVFAVVYVGLAVSLLVGYAPLPVRARKVASWIGGHWTGLFVYLLMFFFVADLVLAVGRVVKVEPTTGVRFGEGLVVVLLAAGVVGYGLYNARRIVHVSYDVRLPGVSGMTIVVVSDLHLGSVGSGRNFAKVVAEVNAVDADLVCLVGDIFNDDYQLVPGSAQQTLESIRCAHVYACLGNHDSARHGFDEMVSLLERSGVRVLKDEYEAVGGITLVGRLDCSPISTTGDLKRTDTAQLMATIGTRPVVVMDHNPGTIDEYGAETDLILAGHTHRGQMFPANLITRAIYAVDYGYYRKDGSSPQVIVTSGAGTWGIPLRIASNSEVVCVVLT